MNSTTAAESGWPLSWRAIQLSILMSESRLNPPNRCLARQAGQSTASSNAASEKIGLIGLTTEVHLIWQPGDNGVFF